MESTRIGSTPHTIVGRLFTATEREEGKAGGLEAEKGENSREVGSNREGLIPLDCVPCPATSASSPRSPFALSVSHPPLPRGYLFPYITTDEDDRHVSVRRG